MHQPLILVTGAGGQLGKEFLELSHSWPQFRFLFAGKMDLDISVASWAMEYLSIHRPDVVINCAAYTNVERAQDEPEMASQVNDLGAGFIAEACHQNNALLIHISTDYVFNGEKKSPYLETDDPAPLNIYGSGKLEGERKIDAITDRYYTLRTSWLYSTHGHNFFKTMLRLAHERGELKVVNDQVASPTYARWLAADILRLIEKVILHQEHVEHGLYHYTQTGIASWFDFAKEIVKLAGLNIPVLPVSSADFPTKAIRPVYSKLDTSKWITNTGFPIPEWQLGVKACLANRT